MRIGNKVAYHIGILVVDLQLGNINNTPMNLLSLINKECDNII